MIFVFFNGQGKNYGDYKNPDPEEGYEIRFVIDKVNHYAKTVIKNVELIMKEDVPDASNLNLLDVQFGTACWQTRILGNEITWPKGLQDGNAGWNLEGIDLSEYDRVRVELESNDATGLELSINQRDGINYHAFNQQIEKNIFDIYLNGDGASYKDENSVTPDISEGLSIYLHTWNEKPRTKEQKTVVKSVQLLKGKRDFNENLKVLGRDFGSNSCHATVYNGGIINWEGNKDGWGLAGWNMEDIDISDYEKIRIELEPESAQQSFELKLEQEDGVSIYYSPVTPNVLEANFDGNDYSRDDGKKWNPAKKITQILIQFNNLKKDQKTTVKSITLISKDDAKSEVKQPEAIILNGAKLGSLRERAWLDDSFAINWEVVKSSYACCGWRVDNLEAEILEIKVASTEVPLRLRIREGDNNESSWLDDGTHVFRINLKTKKQQSGKNWKDSEWNKKTKEFDFSQGCEIRLEPCNGVYKEGKKTVIESIKTE